MKKENKKCNHLIGIWNDFTYGYNITLSQLKQKIRLKQKLYASLQKVGHVLPDKICLEDFLDTKKTELTIYKFCPLCGEKIDWEKIKEENK